MPYKDQKVRRKKQAEATARWRENNPIEAKVSEKTSNYNRKNNRREWLAERTFRFYRKVDWKMLEAIGLSVVSQEQLECPNFVFVKFGERFYENLHSPLPKFIPEKTI